MLAVRFEQTGGPDVLQVVDVPTPMPGPGQVLIRNQAIGVNFIETYQRSGLYPVKLPSGLGGEGAGVVQAAGEGVDRVKVGDLVAYAGGVMGAYAEYAVLPAARVVKVPDGIDAQTAAASLLKGMTVEAFVMRLRRARMGEAILVHAAAGGVGQIMVQWLKAMGVVVIATVGSDDKAAKVRELGADHVILYREQDVAAEVKRITDGRGVSAAYDSVGKDTFDATLNSLARRGWFVSFGNASGPVPAFEPILLMRHGSIVFTRPTLFDFTFTTQELDASAAAVFSMIANDRVKIEIGQTFALADVRKAHEALEARETIGASLLIP